jgi:hypothetical protein
MSLSFKNDGTCSTQYPVKHCCIKRKYSWPRKVSLTGKIPQMTFDKINRFHMVENIKVLGFFNISDLSGTVFNLLNLFTP